MDAMRRRADRSPLAAPSRTAPAAGSDAPGRTPQPPPAHRKIDRHRCCSISTVRRSLHSCAVLVMCPSRAATAKMAGVDK